MPSSLYLFDEKNKYKNIRYLIIIEPNQKRSLLQLYYRIKRRKRTKEQKKKEKKNDKNIHRLQHCSSPLPPSALTPGHILQNPFDWAPVPHNCDCYVPIPDSEISLTRRVDSGFESRRVELQIPVSSGRDLPG